MKENEIVIGVLGLGYVGLPLAVEFGKKHRTIGYDINNKRITALKGGVDLTLELSPEELRSATSLLLTNDAADLAPVTFFIVTVPTPVDKYNNPDLSIIRKATELVAARLKQGDIVIYESTVYPGVTEECCVPILEKISGLEFNKDFFCGYSPERINPGDKKHTLTKIKKITSGSTAEAAEKVDALYASIITAGTYKASSIKVAEAAKVIENAQRDINIAFVNELAIIFNRLGISSRDVLDAAATKWNFLPFKPGLVGGHCIGVDPFYLAQKAKEVGYHTEIILAGRRLNDGMAEYVGEQFIKLLIKNDCKVKGCKVLVLGVTFKENCPDIRNSKVFDVISMLSSYEMDIVVHDPWANVEEVMHEYNVRITKEIGGGHYDGILVCVGHNEFKEYPYREWKDKGSVIYDIKGILPADLSHGSL
jgi:UDP-N-acetyl-D-galactosamine dehydrogenase